MNVLLFVGVLKLFSSSGCGEFSRCPRCWLLIFFLFFLTRFGEQWLRCAVLPDINVGKYIEIKYSPQQTCVT